MMESWASLLLVDPLAVTAGLCILFFTVLTLVYSAGSRPRRGGVRYFIYILLTLAASLGVVFADHLILLLVCWGLSGVLLYLLIGFGEDERTPATAQKALIILGGSDSLMLLGVVIVIHLGGATEIAAIRLDLNQPGALLALLCLLAAALAKAGAFPLHGWIPDTAQDAPVAVTAFLPASVDKILGIYLLARICLDLFVMTPAMQTLLLVIGAATLLGAGLMMLVQSDFKRLLGYCAISQVGYILLGIASGHPLGIAGGLFHMVNHALYKSCLFFTGGVVERQSGTSDIERLGGLARSMPLTFICFLIAALSVSGIPPFNGFISKWMVYQGIIEAGSEDAVLWIPLLLVAMFGSALTLAGMMKLVHAIFLGQPAALPGGGAGGAIPRTMLIPPLLLAALCVIFGIWAYPLPLEHLILPILDEAPLSFGGVWQPTLATTLIIVAIGLGLLLYLGSRAAGRMRQTGAFIGGEALDAVEGMRVSGGAFFDTIRTLPGLNRFYGLESSGVLDLYRQGSRLTFGMVRPLRALHGGLLPLYLAWILLGALLLLLVLLLW